METVVAASKKQEIDGQEGNSKDEDENKDCPLRLKQELIKTLSGWAEDRQNETAFLSDSERNYDGYEESNSERQPEPG